MSTDLLVETIGPVGLLRLNRPEARNALSNELLGELVETLEQLEKEGTRCGVIAGSDRVFAAGADLRALASTRSLEHLRVPETRFGLLERLLAGSSGAYLMRLLAV